MKLSSAIRMAFGAALALPLLAQASGETCRTRVDLTGPGFNLVVPVNKDRMREYLAPSGVEPAPLPGAPVDPATGEAPYGVLLGMENHEQFKNEYRARTYSEFYVLIPILIDGKIPGITFALLVNDDPNPRHQARTLAMWKKAWNFNFNAGKVGLRFDYAGSTLPTAFAPMGVQVDLRGPSASGKIEPWLSVQMAPRWLDGKFMGQKSDVAGYTDLSGLMSFVPEGGMIPEDRAAGLRFYGVHNYNGLGFTFLPKAEDTVRFSGRLKDFLLESLGAPALPNGQPMTVAFNFYPDVQSSSQVPVTPRLKCLKF